MNPIEIERDMPECEKWNQPKHDEHEPTTYELAEEELKSEERKYIVREMMGADYGKYFGTTAQEIAEDEAQADYERESKLGAI